MYTTRNRTPSSPNLSSSLSHPSCPCTPPYNGPTMMDKMVSFDAILFPADERAPHLVPLMTSDTSTFPPPGQSGSQPPPPPSTKIPHPEMYMDFIAEGVGARAWQHHVSFTPPSMAFACFHPPSAFQIPPLGLISLVARPARSRSGVGGDPFFYLFVFPSRFA